ncbi:hypothetical protein F4778DRAFT_706312 [Xylariomycetidae sp. FL2044]|nr:hypothetical protein F4778DRAFT_706312 [Xylariomycetidae sp. FL2044]
MWKCTIETQLAVMPKQFIRCFKGNVRRQACLRVLRLWVASTTDELMHQRDCCSAAKLDMSPQNRRWLFLSSRFTIAFYSLFNFLRTWNAGELFQNNEHGITLELRVSLESPQIPHTASEEHGGIRRRGVSYYFYITEHPHSGKMDITLPDVQVITGFKMLQHNAQRLDFTSLREILTKLPRLRHLHLEPWVVRRWRGAHNYDFEFDKLSDQVLLWPSTLRTISIFHTSYLGGYGSELVVHGDVRANPCLGRQMAQRSFWLESLHSCNQFDAVDFFHDPLWLVDGISRKLPYWKSLRYLTLTSDVIDPGRQHELNSLLCVAAKASTRMPVLHVMEIYNHNIAGSGLLSYVKYEGRGSASLIWKRSWRQELDYQTVQAWDSAASSSDLELTCFSQVVPEYETEADFIHDHLITRPLVLDIRTSVRLMNGTDFDNKLARIGCRSSKVIEESHESEAAATRDSSKAAHLGIRGRENSGVMCVHAQRRTDDKTVGDREPWIIDGCLL